jgi:hypothetical protein
MATSSMKALRSPGKVAAKTSPLKKLRFTASQPGASGTSIDQREHHREVEPAAIMLERRLSRAS